MSKATHPDIPERSWSNPFSEGTPLHERYGKIVSENRDIIIVVDDYYARRGTGKTVASLQLANGMDSTDEGVTHEKVTLQPEELRNAYSTQPKRSGLVLDEGELGASNRQAMSKVNQALREIMSIGRVQEKYVVVNTPLKKFLDSDILKLADIWISMVRKGLGLVHFLEWEPYSEQLLSPRKQWLEFEDIPTGTELRDVYNELTRQKQGHIDGDGGTAFIPESEHYEELEKARKEAKREKRNELVRGLFDHPEIAPEISQRMVGEAAGVSQKTVSNILNDDDNQ